MFVAIRPGSILPGIALIISILLALFVLPSPWGLIVVICGALVEIVEITWGLQAGAQALHDRRAHADRPRGRRRARARSRSVR